MTPHRQLLAEFAENGSHEAFHELVSNYVGMVYGAALRLVNGDTHRAKDVVQTVFADLARHARTVSDQSTIGGWLHQRTCYVALTMLRAERRRINRERIATELRAVNDNNDEAFAELAPLLDEAINELDERDRDAIILRFFQRSDLRSVGEAMGISEDAAQKRVARALEKLRVLLTRRQVTLSVSALAFALGGSALNAAPAGIVDSVSGAALAKVGSGVTATTTKVVIMTKLKGTLAAALTAAVLVGTGTTAFLMSRDGEWEPGNLTPSQVLKEAREDARDGRYSDALKKHLWYHNNALRLDPGQTGVRVSFALSDWKKLADNYPPALQELRRLQDNAEKTVRQPGVSDEQVEAFTDFVALNRLFDEKQKTVELFRWLDQNNRDLARKVYIRAEAVLLAEGEYQLSGWYLDPQVTYQRVWSVYNQMTNLPRTEGAGQAQAVGASNYVKQVTALMAALVRNARHQDAEAIAARAVQDFPDPSFRNQLEAVKKGELSAP